MPKSKRSESEPLLDYPGLRAECARVIDEDGRTLQGIAEAVVAAIPDRDGLTRSAVSNAKNSEGGGVAKLQADIIETLTGASITGPFFRVS